MSTNTKKKHGTGAAVVLIVLCLLALGTLGYIIWRQFNPVVPETAAGYVAAAGTTAPVYDENGTQLGSLVRGAEVQYVVEDAEGGADRVRVVVRWPTWPQTWRRPVRTAASAWSTVRAMPIWTRPT